MEMKILRLMVGATPHVTITSALRTYDSGLGGLEIAEKSHQARLQWFSHVLHVGRDKVCQISFKLEIPGKLLVGHDTRQPQVGRNLPHQAHDNGKDHKRRLCHQTEKC
ncbi:hypothetical protein ANCDUO_17616 [Ancylostoma duodenale]|uniref:Uncharacterized protein n=1 Tax=Ancylostoma duodenale TaxID=51022 RepID=A0A0C2C7L2_9BILA|nr:hypothetical protein ANCDUO_17616 [Ancylostoma duodenale]